MTLKDIGNFDQNEIEGWLTAVSLYEKHKRKQKISDLPYSSLQFKNGDSVWRREVKSLENRVLVDLDLHEQQQKRDNDDPRIKKNWELMTGGRKNKKPVKKK